MNTFGNGQDKSSQGFVEQENEIKKYLRILKKRKFMITMISLGIFLFWTTYVVLFDSKPVYSAETLLHFQNANRMTAIGGERADRHANDSRISFLQTEAVLGEVVEALQTNIGIETDNVSKDAMFDYVYVTKKSIPGSYKLAQASDGTWDLLYSNEETRITDELLLNVTTSDTVFINDVTFKLNEGYMRAYKNDHVIFYVKRFDRAVQSIRGSTSTFWLDRRNRTNLKISAFSRNPQTAADMANVLAAKFIKFDLDLKNSKTNEMLFVLNKELEVAHGDLEVANQKVQRFQERNPSVIATALPVAPAAGLQQSRNTLQLNKSDFQNAIKQVQSTNELGTKMAATRELLSYLATEGVPVAAPFEAEFAELGAARTIALRNYAPTHPVVSENEGKLRALINKTVAAANDQISKIDGRIKTVNSQIYSQTSKLRALPQKQRELSELLLEQGVKRDMYERILTRKNAAEIKRQVEVGDIAIVDKAIPPAIQSPVGIIIKKSMVGLIVGLALALGLAIVVEFFDKTVQSSEDLQSRLKLPVLGNVPVINDENDVPGNIKDLKGKRDTKLITLDYSPTLESESYRDLRTKILFANPDKAVSSFIITSLRPSEGKSLTSSNLAITFAQQKISTLIIDADLRRGVLHNVYGNKKKPGLSDFLISKATVDYDNVNKLIQKTIIPNLYIITTGSPIPNPTEMLGSERMTNLLNVLKSRFGMVILDTAPFQASSDAPILSTHVDGVVVVVRADYTNVDQLKQKIQEYPNIHRKILGLVLNMVKLDSKKQRYQYSYYNY